ncbi:MAG: TRAP transporter small permease subunit [Alphaproteobacteria bacterium]
MKKFIDLVGLLSRICGVFAAALVGAAIIVVCQMVVMRYFLNASTVWQTEFVIYSLVASTFIGSPYVLLVKGHVNVDLLPIYLGQKGRYALALLASTLGLIFCATLTWTGAEFFYEAWAGGWTTDTVWRLPLWIPYLSIPLGIGVLCLQYVADIVALATGHSMPFAMDQHSAQEGE